MYRFLKLFEVHPIYVSLGVNLYTHFSEFQFCFSFTISVVLFLLNVSPGVILNVNSVIFFVTGLTSLYRQFEVFFIRVGS